MIPNEQPITKAQSRTSTLNRNSEIFSLTPSTLLTLWEVDASVILDESGIKAYDQDAVFRFHNSIKLTTNSIYWRGLEYVAAPIQAEGFEHAVKGSPPTPKLSIAVNDEGVSALSFFKATIRKLDDLTGVKVTRRRVFAKYIDGINFSDLTKQDLASQGFSPDPNQQFEPDIYYIDRKSMENKSVIEFELASSIDIDGVQLPRRIVSAKRCPFSYRGFGCFYEYAENRVEFIHGPSSTLPEEAPPVANDKNESITDILGPGVKIIIQGEYTRNKTYNKGWATFIQKDGIKYYFVAKQDGVSVSPPNALFWIADSCSKNIDACRLRFGSIGDQSLNFGGFPAVQSSY